jgi:hypothetical protein
VSLKRGPLSLVIINEELLERKVATVGIRPADHTTPFYPQKLALNLADKWRLLSR